MINSLTVSEASCLGLIVDALFEASHKIKLQTLKLRNMKVSDTGKHVHECKYLSNACFRNIHKITGETPEIRSDISDKMKPREETEEVEETEETEEWSLGDPRVISAIRIT